MEIHVLALENLGLCLSCEGLKRRWIERYNAKLREVGKKEERRRLKEFIVTAYELDPRVARRKQEKKAERCAALLLPRDSYHDQGFIIALRCSSCVTHTMRQGLS